MDRKEDSIGNSANDDGFTIKNQLYDHKLESLLESKKTQKLQGFPWRNRSHRLGQKIIENKKKSCQTVNFFVLVD